MLDRGITAFVRRLSEPGRYHQTTDRELLGLFVNDRDEAAFDILFRRHERLVRTAIARVLTDPDDAADALQATFLVLLRRAKVIDWKAELGPWLFGVAHRVAVRLRARQRRQPTVLGADDAASPGPPPDPSWREACELLHAELDRLPDRYRLPLLICYLEGKTRDEAAAALGLTAGVVKGRVRRGCALLHSRLARRGVTLSVGLFAATTSQAVGEVAVAVATCMHSPRVEELVREVTRAMTHTNLKLVTLAFVLLAGAVCAFGLAETAPRPAVTAAAPVPRRPPPVFLVQISSVNVILDADGKEIERFDKGMTNGTLSSDGAWLACADFRNEGKPTRNGSLTILPRGHKAEPTTAPHDLGEAGTSGTGIVWSRDGRRLVVSDERASRQGNSWVSDTKFWVYDRDSKRVTDLKLPNVTSVTGWSPDSKRLLANVMPPRPAHGDRVGERRR